MNETGAKSVRYLCLKCGHVDEIGEIPAFNTVCTKCGGTSLKLSESIDDINDMLRVVRDYLKEFDILIANYFDFFSSIKFEGFNIPMMNMVGFAQADFVAKSPEMIDKILGEMDRIEIDRDKLTVKVSKKNDMYAIIVIPNIDWDNRKKNPKEFEKEFQEKSIYREQMMSAIYPFVLGGLQALAEEEAETAKK